MAQVMQDTEERASTRHVPVLPAETLEALAPRAGANSAAWTATSRLWTWPVRVWPRSAGGRIFSTAATAGSPKP